MKLKAEQMVLFALDYGDLIRPEYEILRGWGWSECTNRTNEYLIVFGPKAATEHSVFDTSPYILPPGAVTPDVWDCKGFLVPSDRCVVRWWKQIQGPFAVKFWNHRSFSVWHDDPATYRCSWDNGIFYPSQINWAIPNFSYDQILTRLQGSTKKLSPE